MRSFDCFSCRQENKYLPLNKLPQTSVIICFFNEAWSTLLRTVHSVLRESSPELLKEIILVDDYSDIPLLMDPLDLYMSRYPKVKIIRTTKREGLAHARMIGKSHSKGKILTFLDSHCECQPGWLTPLIDRVYRYSNHICAPLIDSISLDTFEYKQSDEVMVGGFSWDLDFTWEFVPDHEQHRRKDPSTPYYTPTIAGKRALFSR